MVLKYWFIIIWAKPGNCKSLEQARITKKLLKEYRKTERRYPALPQRFVFTNQILNKDLKEVQEALATKHLYYWDEPKDFRYCPRKNCWRSGDTHKLHDCDLLIDEGSTLFPADKWADTPIWLRKMWSQHRHNGLRIVMLTQDAKAIDISCRRMVWMTYFMKKLWGSRDISPSLPPLVPFSWKALFTFKSFIWGIYSKRMVDPDIIEQESGVNVRLRLSDSEKAEHLEENRLVGLPEYHLITKNKVNFYDTTQDVKEYEVEREIEHIEAKCKHINCGYIHRTHRIK